MTLSEYVKLAKVMLLIDRKYMAFTPWLYCVSGKINPTDVFTRRQATVQLPTLLAVVVLVVPIRPDAHFPGERATLEVFVPRVAPNCIVTGHLAFLRRGCVRRNVLRQDELQPFQRVNTPPKPTPPRTAFAAEKTRNTINGRTQEHQHETPAWHCAEGGPQA